MTFLESHDATARECGAASAGYPGLADAPWSSATSFLEKQTLLAAVREGDERAFERLYHRCSPRVMRIAYRFLGSEDEARDCVQDTFLAAYRSCAQFEGRASVESWLYRIAINAALMRLRTRGRRNEDSIDNLMQQADQYELVSNAVQAEEEPVDVLLERQCTVSAVRDAIERLPPTFKAVLVLRDLEEHNTTDTATLLGVTPGAAKVRLHRARAALRTLLEPVLQGPVQ